MKQASRKRRLDRLPLREMFTHGAAWLESQVEPINALNVFPVPDGDTGTNMFMTIREALDEASRVEGPSASEFLAALAHGALMGAKGNSGVILSQILRGMADASEGREHLGASDLVRAFREAARLAYKAVSQPAEGTMLTVMREVAEAVAAADPPDPLAALEVAYTTAVASVARTPLRLAVLRENGVVDAGGQGLATLFEGMLHSLKGDAAAPPPPAAASLRFARVAHSAEDHSYGFCTEFFIQRPNAGLETVRTSLASMAKSVLLAGDAALIKVHLHTLEPEAVLAHAGSFGAVERVKVENMDAQHQDYRARGQSAAVGKTGVVAVVSGAGMEALFRSLGAGAIVPGGQTMNPSVEDILRGVAGLPQNEVIIIPNNENVILAAQQAARIAINKSVSILATRDMAQGLSAMVAFSYDADARKNLEAMTETLASVKTGEVTCAVREARVGGATITRGQAMGLSQGALIAIQQSPEEAMLGLLEQMGVEAGSAVTIYYGANTSAQEAEAACRRIRERFPEAEVRTYSGGLPNYHYLVSVE